MKILLVEDDDDMATVLTGVLEEEGYAVDRAADGEEGLYRAQEWDYDAVLLDIMLPGIDGRRVLRRLRGAKDTPVLLLTARGGLADRVGGLDLEDRLYDEDQEVASNTLEVLVSRLRRKLGKDLIATSRGTGYGIG